MKRNTSKVKRNKNKIFNLTQDMPLYNDMEEILQRKTTDKIEKVWNE